MIDEALAYAAQGWPVFPCGALKEPLTSHGVNDATTDPAKIRTWWAKWPRANIGCHVGAAGLMVIDLDPGHDIDAVHRAFEGLPPTLLRQRTPRGGEHLFYALAPGEQVKPSASKVADFVDIRSAGSYVLLAPSRTIDGPGCAEGVYEWQHPDWPAPKPAYRTDAMVRVAGERRQRTASTDEWIIAPDLEANIRLAIEWLQSDKCSPAIEGQGGGLMTVSTAAMMRSHGLSEETALRVMFDVYNVKCDPPWELDELAGKVANGYRYASSPPGNVTPAYKEALVARLFKPVSMPLPSGREQRAGRYRMTDRQGVEHIQDPEWLIPDLLPRGGYGLLVGAPGTFKTFVALDIALSVASGSHEGRAWSDVREAGPVLLAVGEGRAGLKPRIAAWEARHNGGKLVENLVLADPVPLVSAGAAEWGAFCDLALTMHPLGYALMVIDTAGRSLQGLNENAQEAVSMFTQLVQTLQTRLACAVLAIHHTGHSDATRAKGSGVFHADPDTVLVLSRPGKARTISLAMAKQKDAPEWEQPRSLALADESDSLVVLPSAAAPPNPGFKPVAPPLAEKLPLPVVQEAVEAVLATGEMKNYSHRLLAADTAHLLGTQGHQVTMDAVRKKYLPQLVASGHPAYRRIEGRGHWRHATVQ